MLSNSMFLYNNVSFVLNRLSASDDPIYDTPRPLTTDEPLDDCAEDDPIYDTPRPYTPGDAT